MDFSVQTSVLTKAFRNQAQGGRRGMSHDQRIDGVVERQHPLLQDAEEDDDEIQVVPGPIPTGLKVTLCPNESRYVPNITQPF